MYRVSQNTPKLCDRGGHLPNWAPWVQNQPKNFGEIGKFLDSPFSSGQYSYVKKNLA